MNVPGEQLAALTSPKNDCTQAFTATTTRRLFLRMGAVAIAAMSLTAKAQPSAAIPRIGFLGNANPALQADSIEAFQRGLRELGWIDGKNIVIEYRWADGDMTRHARLASELAKLPVTIIVTAGTQAVRAAQQATKTIPIVVTIMPDPVALGFAASLARPGGNITGVANLFEELTPKQLQIFEEVLPKAKRIALLSDRTMGDTIVQATETAARNLHLVPRVFTIEAAREIETAIQAAKNDMMDGVLVLPSPVFNRSRGRIADLALKQRLATLGESSEYVRDGCLLSYGPSFPQMYYRAANYVDRILRGENPGDLPIERPSRFELVVNLKTAKTLGITIPQPLLLRADQVIQ